MKHPLASKDGLTAVLAFLLADGYMCPDCAIGTRAISAKFRACKKCGRRFERKEGGK